MERTMLLDGLPIRNIEHLGRPLREHLVGTHRLLDRWGNPEHVCLAGLFHSIYGTKSFPAAAVATESRERVRRTIGEDAESLVFIFGMSDRKRLLLENRSAPYYWVDYRSGERTEVASEVLNELVEIEVANFTEQMLFLTEAPESVFQDMRHRFETTTSCMSVGAREAFCRAFDGRTGGAFVSGKQDP